MAHTAAGDKPLWCQRCALRGLDMDTSLFLTDTTWLEHKLPIQTLEGSLVAAIVPSLRPIVALTVSNWCASWCLHVVWH